MNNDSTTDFDSLIVGWDDLGLDLDDEAFCCLLSLLTDFLSLFDPKTRLVFTATDGTFSGT